MPHTHTYLCMYVGVGVNVKFVLPNKHIYRKAYISKSMPTCTQKRTNTRIYKYNFKTWVFLHLGKESSSLR